MPAYIVHTKMSNDVFNKLNDNKIDYSYMITYSLGWDLSKYSKVRKITHKKYTKEFFNNMITYIKDNNLSNNKKIIGALYGHISHYILDDTIHPLVRTIDKNTLGKKRHTRIESYYDYYIINGNLINYNKKLINTKMDKEVKKMLDYVYYKTYHIKNIHIYYKLNLLLYRSLYYIYKTLGLKTVKYFSKFPKYLKDNKEVDILNNNHLLFKNSFSELYQISIDKTLDYINNLDIFSKR